jgi:hypothetical protein
MSTRPIRLVRASTGELVDAVLHQQLTAEQVIAAETVWGPFRQLASENVEHSHWDWGLKVGLLSRAGHWCMGIECDESIQGMILVRDAGDKARLDPDRDRPLLYVDYLEVAPWNLPAIVPDVRFKGVGRALVRAAVSLSSERGMRGRIGLHSLPQAEGFYETGCGMFAVGQDPRYNGLMYYELTVELAARLVGG